MVGFSRREMLEAALALPPLRAMLNDRDNQSNLRPNLYKITVPIPGLDRRLDGMRIGQISDVHVGLCCNLDHLESACRVFDRNPPEMLAVTGDLTDDASLAGACFDIISTVKAPYGRYFIMGNHDNKAGRDEVLAAARSHEGIKTLVNEELDTLVQGAKVHISGVDFPEVKGNWNWKAHVKREFVKVSTKKIDNGDFRLCLAHHPDNFDELAAKGVELTLSGHTHGGQVAPFATFMAERVFKYVYGLYRHNASHLYVSGGTGHWFPLRVGVPAEVTELTLRRV